MLLLRCCQSIAAATPFSAREGGSAKILASEIYSFSLKRLQCSAVQSRKLVFLQSCSEAFFGTGSQRLESQISPDTGYVGTCRTLQCCSGRWD
jgi:hypothetical protein